MQILVRAATWLSVTMLTLTLVASAQGEDRSRSEVVRLYHFREAGAIAEVLERKSSEDFVKSIGSDLVIIDAPPGEDERRHKLKRLIQQMDLPRPQISMRFFSSQLNAKGDDAALGDALGLGHELLRRRVRDLSGAMQGAIRRGVWYLSEQIRCYQATSPSPSKIEPRACPEKGIQAIDHEARIFRDYIQSPLREGENYTLAYRDAFAPFPASLSRLFLLLAATDNPSIEASKLVSVMEGRWPGQYFKSDLVVLCDPDGAVPKQADSEPKADTSPRVFRSFGPLLAELLERGRGRRLRSALADYLFHYKWSVQYPDDFVSYDLRRSADTLDSLFGGLVEAFNADLEVCVDRAMRRLPWEYTDLEKDNRRTRRQAFEDEIAGLKMQIKAASPEDKPDLEEALDGVKRRAERDRGEHERRKSLGKKIGYASNGLVAVSSLSGRSAKVDGGVKHYFGFQKPISFGDALEAAKEALNDDDDETSALDVLKNDPRVAAANVALAIAKAAADPERTTVAISDGTSVEVTPMALSSAASAELEIKLKIGEREEPKQTKGDETKTARIDRIVQHTVEDTVRVESLKLFELSTFAQGHRLPGSGCWWPGTWDVILSREVTRCPYPVVGHAVELLVGPIPWLGNKVMKPLSIDVGPKTSLSQSSAVISALVVPTAADIALGLRFDLDGLGEKKFDSPRQLLPFVPKGLHTVREYHKGLVRTLMGLDGPREKARARRAVRDGSAERRVVP